MRVLGITGGVGSGKSEVLRYMKNQYSAVVCELDEVAKTLQEKGSSCYSKIIEAFGQEVVSHDGQLDRQKLAQIIFSNQKKRMEMNNIVHPAVKRWVECDIIHKQHQGTQLYIIEAALLLDAGYTDICEEMWYVYTEDIIRRERLEKSRGYSAEKISRIFMSQPSETVFRQMCGVVIDNSGTFEDTKRQIGEHI